jgi:threonine dehydratase
VPQAPQPQPAWPITLRDVLEARQRIAPHIPRTPLRGYAGLDALAGSGIRVLVKHENHNPTGAFKARNALSAMLVLSDEQRARGVIGATRGNHGQGLAWAGQKLGVNVTVCVPVGNNPDKNEAMRGYGARLVEEGADYDASVKVADRLMRAEGLTLVHSTNNLGVLAGAATISLEILEDAPEVEAIVVGVGGGSQAVGAVTVARALKPSVEVFGVQAAGAPGLQQSWKAGTVLEGPPPATIADGLATRVPQPMTFDALRSGLADFVLVSEDEIATGVRDLLRTTHNLPEPSAAVPLAGIIRLRERLAGKTVAFVFSGGNVDAATLRQILA